MQILAFSVEYTNIIIILQYLHADSEQKLKKIISIDPLSSFSKLHKIDLNYFCRFFTEKITTSKNFLIHLLKFVFLFLKKILSGLECLPATFSQTIPKIVL